MLTKLKNGVRIRLAEVKLIKVERLSKGHGWESEWGVQVAHGDSMLTMTETCVFDGELAAHAYADEIAGKACEEQAAEFNTLIEKDQRRDRDRNLDRICALASGILAGTHGKGIGTIQAVLMARDALDECLDESVLP